MTTLFVSAACVDAGEPPSHSKAQQLASKTSHSMELPVRRLRVELAAGLAERECDCRSQPVDHDPVSFIFAPLMHNVPPIVRQNAPDILRAIVHLAVH